MPNVNLSFTTRRALGLNKPGIQGSESLRYIANLVQDIASGRVPATGATWCLSDVETFGNAAAAGDACGLVSLATASGAVGVSALAGSGTPITVTAAGGDAATAGLLAAAINASAAVNRLVSATHLGAAVTLASVTAGQFIDICGQRFTATTGASGLAKQFNISGTDTQDAAALCLAINQDIDLGGAFNAVNVAGRVMVFPSTSRLDSRISIVNAGSFATFTVNNPVQTAQAACCIMAVTPGIIGNLINATATGTGATFVTNGAAGFLGHGSGGGSSPQFVLP